MAGQLWKDLARDGMMMSPDEAMSGMQGEGLASGVDLVAGTLADAGQFAYAGGNALGSAVMGNSALDAFTGATESPWWDVTTEGASKLSGMLGDAAGAAIGHGGLMDYSIADAATDGIDFYRDTARPWLQKNAGEYAANLLEGGAMAAAAVTGGKGKRVVGKKGMDLDVTPTVDNPQRVAYPGIYKPTDEIVEESMRLYQPESSNLERLFGVNRSDLTDYAMTPGDDPRQFLPGMTKGGKGNALARNVMTDDNAGRLSEIITEAYKTPLGQDMAGWYGMQPIYDRQLELTGSKSEAADRFRQLNHLQGFHSANSEVPTEIVRGSAANWLANEGRIDDYYKYGNKNDRMDRPDRPEDMDAIPGHMGHATSHGKPTSKYLEDGSIGKAPKVPAYIAASGVPEAGGRQSAFAVGDAHFSRGIGLADVRNPQVVKGETVVPGASWSMPEAQTVMPWFSEVAGETGLENVPKQAILWGALSPQTGVTSPIGAPKLEVIADLLAEKTAPRLSKELGRPVSPEEARDMYLMGKTHAGFADPQILKWLGLLGAGGYIGSGMLSEDVEESELAERFKPRMVD